MTKQKPKSTFRVTDGNEFFDCTSYHDHFELCSEKDGREFTTLDLSLLGLRKCDIPPENWWCHHLSTCGTMYRGCDPKCPKEVWEETGKWTG